MVSIPASRTPNVQVSTAIRRQEAGDAKATVGLQDKGTADERLAKIREVDSVLQQNYSREATTNLVNALTNNNKIVNSGARRGQVVDISV